VPADLRSRRVRDDWACEHGADHVTAWRTKSVIDAANAVREERVHGLVGQLDRAALEMPD
jgi:hypothetical protein